MPQYATPDGGVLHYETHGSGESAMLMLHGLSQSSITFKGMVEALVPGKTLYLCDLPGHGESYRPMQYHNETMIADITELLRDVIGQPTIVYGHSLGSLVATGLASEAPELVSRLILSDPPLVVWDAERWQDSLISSYFGWARKTLNAGFDRERIIPMLQAAFPHRAVEVVQDQATALTQLDVAILDALFDGALATREEVLALFEGIQCPALLLQADPRILAAASDADIADIQARITADSRHEKFSGADHDLHLWKQDRILQAVEDFLGT